MEPQQESEFGDFEEIKTEGQQEEQKLNIRVRTPRKGQLIGVVLQRLGGNRMSIKTTDNKTRNCRVPGRFSRKFWLRPGNIVIIEPWPDDDNKGEIVYQYSKNEAMQLKRQGIVNKIYNEF
ncbi:translation initiation factor eIF-1A [Candidatus Pacearchaeota archaeon]|nr:translation initiation factor eIF-1A [Candidatus Pacearchaeota archaeon]